MMERPERIEKRLEDIERECRAREEEQVREQQKRDEELRAEEVQRLQREAQMREDQRKLVSVTSPVLEEFSFKNILEILNDSRLALFMHMINRNFDHEVSEFADTATKFPPPYAHIFIDSQLKVDMIH